MKILVGSSLFFKDLPEFEARDVDTIEIIKRPRPFVKKHYSLYGNDIMIYAFVDKAAVLHWHKHVRKDPLDATHLLVPDVLEMFDLTLADITPILDDAVPKLKPKWQYEVIIWNAYKANGSFTLTEAQRLAAFESYKAARQ